MVTFKINDAQYKRVIKEMKGLSDKQTEKEYSKMIRNGSRTMVADMKLNAPTADNDNIERNIGITTAKKWTKKGAGARIGVVKNNTANIGRFSAQALASAIEHGTQERYRSLSRSFGIITGAIRTGKVTAKPWLRGAWDRNLGGLIRYIESQIEGLIK